MKKLIGMALAFLLLCSCCVFADNTAETDPRLESAVILKTNSPRALVRGRLSEIDADSSVVPYIKEGRALVPLRFTAEALQATVDWNADARLITVSKGSQQIQFTLGETSYRKDGTVYASPVAPLIRNGRTLLPLRTLSEAFGYQVFFAANIIIVSEAGVTFDAALDAGLLDTLNDRLYDVPTAGSNEMLADLLNSPANYAIPVYSGSSGIGVPQPEQTPPGDSASGGSGNSTGNAGSSAGGSGGSSASGGSSILAPSEPKQYSTTNVQVEGVDEADIVKTDGEHIYMLGGGYLTIAKAVPADEMEVLSRTKLAGDGVQFQELYADDGFLTVIGSTNSAYDSTGSAVQVNIYDVSEKTAPRLQRTVALSGTAVSTRKIGNTFYLVTEKQIPQRYNYTPEEMLGLLPKYRDSASGNNITTMDAGEISYFPDNQWNCFLSVAALDITAPESGLYAQSFLAAADHIYLSPSHLYITGYRNTERTAANLNRYGEAKINGSAGAPGYVSRTDIYKFDLKGAGLSFAAKGTVDGVPLNQFSMDEQDGYLRIATTVSESGRHDNSLYILDSDLAAAGSITGIAPGESIYSCRFMGKRGYMVTFRETDPLYVLDLSDPYAPKILGELKIPGFSNYLHPYDETHLIGFGEERTVAVAAGSAGGTPTFRAADNNGSMKIALFDVSNPASPKTLFTEYIGLDGTNSEVLSNHKALLFDREKQLLAFPVTAVEAKEQSGWRWFNGAYVYHLDLDKGFSLQKKISHKQVTDSRQTDVRRLLYSGDSLYAVSEGRITAYDMAADYQETGSLEVR